MSPPGIDSSVVIDGDAPASGDGQVWFDDRIVRNQTASSMVMAGASLGFRTPEI